MGPAGGRRASVKCTEYSFAEEHFEKITARFKYLFSVYVFLFNLQKIMSTQRNSYRGVI